MEKLVVELRSRWRQMFEALARGEDLPPALRLRAEGMMEAAVLSGAASAAEIDRLLEECCVACTGTSLAAELGDDWRSVYPFPQLPLWMRRAPVYPSTAD